MSWLTGSGVAGAAADGVADRDAPLLRPAGAEVTADGGPGGWCANAGESAVVALNSNRAAVTSRCTAGWMPPASGTRAGIPVFRTAALTSVIRHTASCSQASQTTTEKILRMARMSSR